VVGLESKTEAAESQVRAEGGSFTNALQLKARYEVLKEREDLKYAALDCWQLIADHLPAGTSLQRLSFADGRKLSLNGTVAQEDLNKIIDFDDTLHKATLKDEPMFDPTAGDPFTERSVGNQVTWNFGLVLQHGEDSQK
jgi:hypothetical protein